LADVLATGQGLHDDEIVIERLDVRGLWRS
jgi:hypothetical protein